MLRTHTCGELRPEHAGTAATLAGWVDHVRDHKGVIFIDLRDRYGRTQVVVGPESGEANLTAAKKVRPEWVLQVTGRISPRPEGTVNAKLPTGGIELAC